MKKVLVIFSFLAFLTIGLLGFQAQDKANTEERGAYNEWQEKGEVLFGEHDITKAILKETGHSSIEIEDVNELKTLKQMITSAYKEKGIVNMTKPSYSLAVTDEYNKQHRYHLWIGKKGEKSAFMKQEETHYIYTTSEEMTDILIQLIE
ncbi:hypothetical protein [Alkalihalobacterium bogoriense]|uniref:hypothetical protein n=1 Tax=Alkalihalobacterium bogoriense TaxID=246272 RepID=UPI000686B512|nr:hypothetical protein [Alkalihalobacterium bogoriense]